LAEVLSSLPQSTHPNLLVGFNKADDAGVYRLSETQALVQTVDFFPPIVDDPYWFGQIAAANALSDVYAMGGTPLTALNIVGFPIATMPREILTDILRGGNEKVVEAGAVVVGGHSIKDKELKFGLAVTGLIDPRRIVTNSGARPGDVLFLTKALGTGIITTAIKRNAVETSVIDVAIRQMAALNKIGAELMVRFGAHAATDITGYGLLGHAYEMAAGSDVTIRISAGKLPVLPDALRLAELGMNPGGSMDNREYLMGKVQISKTLNPNLEHVLYDPQTSGGLFTAIPESAASGFMAALGSAGLPNQPVGRVEKKGPFPLIVEY
jgi:selenide,water dikinase